MSNFLKNGALSYRSSADTEGLIREIDQSLQTVTEKQERALLLLNKAVYCGTLGHFDDAREQLSLVAMEEKNDPEICLQLAFINGCLFHEEGRIREALAVFSRTLSEFSELLSRPDGRFIYEEVQQRRAFELMALDDYEKAINLLVEITSFKLAKEDMGNALANLGICYARVASYELAVEKLTQSRTGFGLSNDMEGQVRFFLGVSYAHLRELHKASLEFEKCAEAIGKHRIPAADIYNWLSWVCKSLGNKKKAEEYSRMASPH